jgi:hypothetical protein
MNICNCGKEFEKKSSLRTHARFCDKYLKKEKKVLNIYVCECGKEFEKSQSLNSHYSHCLIHRNGNPGSKRGGWKISDEMHKKHGKTLSENIKNGKVIPSFKGKTHTLETRIKLSEYRSNSYIDNSFHCKFYIINNGEKTIKVQGTYERDFAEFLNINSIKWDRVKLKYDTVRHYTPDFYLVDYDIYIEVKGWLMDRDKVKYRKFFNERQETIYCCFKEDIKKLINNEIELKDLSLLKNLID